MTGTWTLRAGTPQSQSSNLATWERWQDTMLMAPGRDTQSPSGRSRMAFSLGAGKLFEAT